MTRSRYVCVFLASLFASAIIWFTSLPEVHGNQAHSPTNSDVPRGENGWGIKQLYETVVGFPFQVAVSPTDVVVFVEEQACDEGEHNMLRVMDDGTLEPYAPQIDDCLRGIAFDQDANLYAAQSGGDYLYKIAPDETYTVLATGVAPHDLALDKSGIIYAATTDVIQRITPQGDVSYYADNLPEGFVGHNWDLTVDPVTGTPVMCQRDARETGASIYWVHSDGSYELITQDDRLNNCWIAFTDDGKFYANNWNHLYEISLADGSLTENKWYFWEWKKSRADATRNIVFDSHGRIISIHHGYGHVHRIELGVAIEVLYHNVGNGTALAVAPDGSGAYVGISYPGTDGLGRIMRVEDNGSLTTVLDDLPQKIDYLEFDEDGTAYIATSAPVRWEDDDGWKYETTIYTTTLDVGTGGLISPTEYITDTNYINGMAIDPTTGFLWVLKWDKLWYLDDLGVRHEYPFPGNISDENGPGSSLGITPDGTVYIGYLGSGFPAPVEMGIYRLNQATSEYEFVADLSTINLAGLGGWSTAGSDGNVYWIGEGDRYSPNDEYAVYMLQITPGGQVTRIGINLPLDTFGIAGDPNSTDVYFTSGMGIYRMFEAEMIFLPLVTKSSN